MALRTEHWGPADGPRALLVHGITSSAATMEELATAMAAAGWSCTAVDLPGHGTSGPATSYAFADVADAIHDQLGGGFDLYVGHSLGGAVGTVLLARHPDTAARAVLLDPALLAPPERLRSIVDGVLPAKEDGPAEVAAANPRWSPRTVELRVEATQAVDPDAVRAFVEDNVWDVREDAARVTVPVRVLVSTSDSAVAPQLLDELPAANPLWSFETVADTGHSLHRDRPEAVLERVLAQ
ncbi:alpha/beta hydrolase [Marmoricola endophyticus]|uniref:Alpha/beta hydrolase n=1 Tax=Marmoricola endophyticus TaxID=2040280 RepID=A0A917BMP7_9ACTN|nr:alpha/beta fold hydrolase [Marmoricola endophyticus]GGF49897.1 alpha/beta hydrolase [Marmoricola endophyticus]